MTEYRKAVPGDATILPGMRTLFADRSQRGEVVYIRDVEYVRREEGPLHLQLLLPDGLRPGARSTLRYPLVVYVQGSAWGEQDVYFSLPKLVPLAQAGFVVASVKHRASTVAKFPAFLQDVKSAIRFLRGPRRHVLHRPQPSGHLGGFLRGPRRPDGGRHRGHGGV